MDQQPMDADVSSIHKQQQQLLGSRKEALPFGCRICWSQLGRSPWAFHFTPNNIILCVKLGTQTIQ